MSLDILQDAGLKATATNNWTANQIFNDDVILHFGTGQDIAEVLNSAGLAANAELTDVIIGISVYANAIPANSLIISNITADGDIVFFTNTGGNSIEIMRIDASVQSVVFPQNSDRFTPTIAFGDGDSGIYEESDDVLVFSVATLPIWRVTSTLLQAQDSQGAAIRNAVGSSTVPNLMPAQNDPNTGIGTSTADRLSLIAGGIEGHRITEIAGVITHQFTGNIDGLTISDSNVIVAANGSGTLDLRNGGVNAAVALSSDTVNFTTGWLYADGNVANIGFGLNTNANQNAADIFITANKIELRSETVAGVFATRIEILENKIGFYGVIPAVQPSTWTITNESADHQFDANATTTDELADIIATLIKDLSAIGIVGTVT